MSWQMRAVAAYFKYTQQRKMATAEKARGLMELPKGDQTPPDRLQKRHRVSESTHGQFTSYRVAATTATADQKVVVYLHGGAYIGGMSPEHWALVSELADAGCHVEVPSYGLAPQFTHRDAFTFLDSVYDGLLTEFSASQIAFAGDSAGGGLALAFAQSLVGVKPVPGQLVLISPWLDVTLADPTSAEIDDPWLSADGLREAGRAWAGGDDPRDPRISPMYGSPVGLPPTKVAIGTRDLFFPDCLTWVGRTLGAGIACDLESVSGAVHVYPLTPTPEGKVSKHRIVAELAGVPNTIEAP